MGNVKILHRELEFGVGEVEVVTVGDGLKFPILGVKKWDSTTRISTSGVLL